MEIFRFVSMEKEIIQIRELLKSRMMSQRELAEELGLSEFTISRFINGGKIGKTTAERIKTWLITDVKETADKLLKL